ncbi:hypothetical protein FEM21_02070 [Flavobacterium seoulense]|uniref:Uncharacterized protein n=1 Tax=Flavobacterium seoulense TaxID=1492738 RepID=A0A066X0J1_9FLAO|nr:hypothetical protein FEM21_02070 [Flavobacterium seoulense]
MLIQAEDVQALKTVQHARTVNIVSIVPNKVVLVECVNNQ